MTYPLINRQNPLILASSSPRRKELLARIGLPFHPVASSVIEEDFNEDPVQSACSLANQKAVDVRPGFESSWILGADTLVVVDNKILGKPENEESAVEMLTLLSGRDHNVITGFCILTPSGKALHSEAVITRVLVKELNSQEIVDYIKTGEPYGKAGSYAIQGIGAFMVESISGSYTNVVGLPVCALIKALIMVGALESFPIPNDSP
ncbi:MAG TPA: nucleoside triphosphate pyrophosphatase [Desulfobacteraceae bacterium]|nr:nucleoside triphosphate pyrophosphatase [Desulfobacteraceae bacterium]HPQ29789.1 nucleoside triphosphate pyrophosphatase [Desulfobacteraceae bacterium]